jgi:hypothetical protein
MQVTTVAAHITALAGSSRFHFRLQRHYTSAGACIWTPPKKDGDPSLIDRSPLEIASEPLLRITAGQF